MPRRQKHNAKGRQKHAVKIIEPKEIVPVENVANTAKYDESNPLVLPSKKRKTVKKETVHTVKKLLTKKQRKKLEKIAETKAKKSSRADVIQAIIKVQSNLEELQQMTRFASAQTHGARKVPVLKATLTIEKNVDPLKSVAWKYMSGAKRRRLEMSQQKLVEEVLSGFSTSDESTDDSESAETSQPTGCSHCTKCSQCSLCSICSQSTECSHCVNRSQCAESNQPKECHQPTESVVSKTPSHSTTVSKAVQPIKPSGPRSSKSAQSNKPSVRVTRSAAKAETTASRRPAVHVAVDRDPLIQAARLKLPILGDEQEIMEAINENAVVIIAGETGSGKTTQIPQFLYEAGYAQEKQIAITEPRRIAAVSMSRRVAEEMNLTAAEVSYVIRYEGNATEQTKIKFMTDGVLVKEIGKDFLLSQYSAIIVDEAHERGIFSDLSLATLSRIVRLRAKRGCPLKLIIMSATLRLSDFVENRRLFTAQPPVLTVSSRQYPVQVRFARTTKQDYIEAAFDSARTIIQDKPDGGILIFVSGRLEVNTLVKKLREAYPLASTKPARLAPNQKKKKRVLAQQLPKVDLCNYSLPCVIEEEDYDAITAVVESNANTNAESSDEDMPVSSKSCHLWVLPLYSMLSTAKQQRVFRPPPEGARLCVVATNIAETSVTIPNIKYVIDTGKTKLKLYDRITGVTRFAVTWTSKACADQRAGRAGRTGPGECFRLYSTALFNDEFPEFSVPDIQLKPVDDICLLLRTLKIKDVANFPFPTPPSPEQIAAAEERLRVIGAVENDELTTLGDSISYFPVLPRFGKMLCLSNQHGLLHHAILLVSVLSVQEIFIGQKKNSLLKKHELLLGDPLLYMQAVIQAGEDLANSCAKLSLRVEAVREARKLQKQLALSIQQFADGQLNLNQDVEMPNAQQCRLLRQLMLSGMGDQVARRVEPHECKNEKDRQKYKGAYHVLGLDEPVQLSKSSCLKKELPKFLVYQELYELHGQRFIRTATAIEPEWLPTFVPFLCRMSEPLAEFEPTYSGATDHIMCEARGTYGAKGWELPVMQVPHPEGLLYYKLMAKFFLDGTIFGKLKRYANTLLSSPEVITKLWAQSLPKVVGLIKVFHQHTLTSKKRIEEVWSLDESCLLAEYLTWVPSSAHREVKSIWPPRDD